MSERVRVFASGFEYDAWYEANCDRCLKQRYDGDDYHCDIERAIDEAGASNGMISREIADRMGCTDQARTRKPDGQIVLGWPCREFERRLPHA